MKCGRFEKLLVPYAEGTLPEKLSRELEEHLSTCESCTRELESLSCVVDVLKTTDYPAMEPAHDIRSRVMARIAAEPARAPWWRSSRLQAWSAAAAGVLLFAVLAVNFEVGRKAARTYPSAQPRLESPRASAPAPETQAGGQREKPSQAVRTEAVAKRTPTDTPAQHMRLLTKDKGLPTESGRKAARSTVAAGYGIAMKPEPIRADRLAVERMGSEKLANKLAEAEAKKAGYDKGSPMAVTPRGGGNSAMTPTDGAMPEAPGPAGPLAFALNPNAPEGSARFESQAAPGGRQQVQQPPSASAVGELGKADDFVRNVGEFGNAMEQPEEARRAASESATVLGLERKLKEHPTSITVLRDLQKSYKETGRAKDEYAITERLTALDPDNAQYWFQRAQAAERAKMPKTAASCYKRAVNFKLPSPNLELAQSRLKVLQSGK